MRALWIGSGIAVWALHFTALYGYTALACARGFPGGIPWAIAVATVIAAAVAVAILVKGYRERSAFIPWMSATVAGLALIAMVYEAIAGLLAPLCA